jgi:hypothetical protein
MKQTSRKVLLILALNKNNMRSWVLHILLSEELCGMDGISAWEETVSMDSQLEMPL